MDPIALALLSALAAVIGVLYIALIGQKSIPEWWRDRRQARKAKQQPTSAISKSQHQVSVHVVGQEKMLAVMKLNSAPGFDLTTKKIPTIGPGDILVRIEATSICGTDWGLYEWSQWAQSRVHPPVVVGHEFCGVIVDRGNEVKEMVIGDIVAAESHIVCGKCSYCQSGYSHVCPNTQIIGVDRDGAFAEYISIPAANAWKMPSEIPLETAAILEPFGNAVHAALSQDLANRNVLITGCGPIGLMATAVARWAGARTVCVSEISEYRLTLAKQMGATTLLKANTPIQNLEQIVMEVTDGQGIDVFLEMSGAASALSMGLILLRNAGRVVFMGIHGEPIRIDTDNLITLKGVTIYGAAGRRYDQTWEKMRNVLIAGGIDLKPLITHEFAMDHVDKAFDLLRSHEVGKIMLRPSSAAPVSDSKHFAPSPSIEVAPNVSWHTAYDQQTNQLIADSKSHELQLLKGELDSLFSAAQEIQQATYGYKRQLRDPKLTTKQKTHLKEQVGELEAELERTRQRSHEVREQIESSIAN